MVRLIFVSFLLLIIQGISSGAQKKTAPKYIFYFIGDGMGLAQAQSANDYLQAVHQKDTGVCFYSFPYRTFLTTHAQNRYVTGSAAAATALAGGIKTSINTIGMDPDHKCDIVCLADVGKLNDYKTGVLSSVFINHATPAAFYAHNEHRSNYYDIALDLPQSGVDFFAGGGFKEPKGENNDKEDAYEFARKAGYSIPESYKEFIELPQGGKVLFSTDVALGTDILEYRINRKPDYPSLADLTAKAIEYLYNDTGFFVMVEGGAIDWCAHDNDAGGMIQETIDFDLAIREALGFYRQHPDETLIIVTADHETGGFALGNGKTPYEADLQLIANQKASYSYLSDALKPLLEQNSGFGVCMDSISAYIGLGTAVKLGAVDSTQLKRAYEAALLYVNGKPHNWSELYSNKNPLAVMAIKTLAAKAGLGWTTYAHTGCQVPVYAIGVEAEGIIHLHDNTDLPLMLFKMLTGESEPKLKCE